MSTDFPSEETIFAAAVEIRDPHGRAEYLASVCAGNDELRRSVERLLQCDETDEKFLETPLLSGRVASERLPKGSLLGPYRIMEVLGEGGFGIVYRAQQTEPIQRDVAIKVIKLGMHTSEIVARFEHERQSLAIMNHPNIATVLDAGSTPGLESLADFDGESESPIDSASQFAFTGGRPYFVMELVQGLPLDKYCQHHELGLADRLDLFLLVCRAVQHAHQRGIVHRDLKPTNVLVADVDGKPQLKVIDFGIAMALESPGPSQDGETPLSQIVGTPDYMSPEQISGGNVDTRTDIYALGAILYKLLTGVTPLALGHTTQRRVDLAAHRICSEKATSPSSRISEQRALAKTAEGESPRSSETGIVASAVRGDLDAIVTKAISKGKDDRYETASELARDIERFQAHEPVSANASGRWYRSRKFVRRHRTAVVLSSLLMAALTTGGIVSVVGFWEARREQRKAEEAADHSAETILLMEELIAALHADRGFGSEYTLRRKLDDFAESLSGRLQDRPLIEARVRQTIGRAYLDFGNVNSAGEQLERSHKLWMVHTGGQSRQTALAKIDLARYKLAASKYSHATQLAYDAREVIGSDEPSPELIELLLVLAKVHQEFGDSEEAEAFIHEARSVGLVLFGEDHETSLMINALIARTRIAMGNPRQGERGAREVIATLVKQGGTDRTTMALARRVLATALRQQGRLTEAEAQIEEALAIHREIQGDEGVEVIRDLLILSEIQAMRGREQRGLATAKEALKLAENASSGKDWLLASSYATIAERLDETAPAQSPEYWRKAAEIRYDIMGRRKIVAVSYRRLSLALRRVGRLDQALEAAEQEFELCRNWRGKPAWRISSCLAVADLCAELNQDDRALSYTKQALEMADGKRVAIATRINLVDMLIWIGATHLADDQLAEMARYRDGALDEYCRRLKDGLHQMHDGEWDEAASSLKAAIEHANWREGPRPSSLACFALAETLARQERFEEAVESLAPVERMLQNDKAMTPIDRHRTTRWIIRIATICGDESLADKWRERMVWPL